MDWTPIINKIIDSNLVAFGILLYLLFPFILCVGGGYLLCKIVEAFNKLDQHIQDCNNTQSLNNQLLTDLKPFIQETNKRQEKTLEIVSGISNRM